LLKLEEISNKKISFEDFELHMAEAGAEDVQIQEENIEIKTKIENLQSVLGKIREIGLEPTESGLQWRAKEMVEVGPEIEGQLSKLFEDLEENDDVEDYFTNAS
jgi:transcriptional/translational regulatory protein YebC/TACO1